MRLAQLARKIGVKPSEIATFLANKNVPIENSSNAKVADDQVEMVLMHYAPELLAPDPVEEVEPREMSEEKAEVAPVQEEAVVTEEEPLVEPVQSEKISAEDSVEAKEVIKPVLMELPGLKVVGKIDLPEPKKKEVENQEEGTSGVAEDKSSNKEKEDRRGRRKNTTRENERRPRKNLVALQREREAREALRRKQQEKERQKELRTKRYLSKVNQYTPQPQRVKKNKLEDEYEVYTSEPEKPKSFIGRILNWFVSE